jgi:hypothetical protein
MKAPAPCPLLLALVALCAACGSDQPGAPGIAPMMAAANAALPQPGERLPDLQGLTLDGERIDNDSLHGRTVLLNLWFAH